MHLSTQPPLTMAALCIISLFLISFSAPFVAAAAGNSTTLTAYEVLEEYDFPVGLLPKGVLGYTLNESTGKFEVYLNGTCSFKIDSYNLKYSSKITGTIKADKLSNLSGIKVKVLFFWLSIVEVTRDGDELAFSVGIASVDFPVENFVESATCGCGFDCVTANQSKSEFNGNYVSAS